MTAPVHADRTARRWYQEPMVWLVIALPLAVVIAGFATLFIAVDAGGADSVRQPVRRTAQMQTADLAPEDAARRLRLRAELERSADTGALALRMEGRPADAARLRLSLAHPVRAEHDRETWLTRSGDAWLGRIPADGLRNDWVLTLEPEDGHWRLHGRLRAGAGTASLQPELAR